jgi:thiamine kinase-like enzyme
MDQSQLQTLSLHYKLGVPKQEPARIYGGLLHAMWRVQGEHAIYAIKELSKDVDLSNVNIIRNYNLTEKIAARFKQKGIQAVSAIEISGQYLYLIDKTGFLVYPWVNAMALDHDILSERHALIIVEILAKIHAINMDVPEIVEPEFDIHTDDKIIALARRASEVGCSFAPILTRNLKKILIANDWYKNAIPILKNNLVVSHGDLDQKNVLWDENDIPFLIDWESARKLNPTYEIVNASLDWSGITTEFNKTVFIKMINAYQEAGGMIERPSFEAAFDGAIGNWINWMVYNIERSCKNEDVAQKNIGVEQVQLVLSTILQLMKISSDLKSLK